jgi:hypothetical protein
MRGEIRSPATGPDPAGRDGVCPGNPAGGDLDPGNRVGLDDVGRRATDVPRALAALDRPVWWHSNLDGPAGSGSRESGKQSAHRRAHGTAVDVLASIQCGKDHLDRINLMGRSGHSGTIECRIRGL